MSLYMYIIYVCVIIYNLTHIFIYIQIYYHNTY